MFSYEVLGTVIAFLAASIVACCGCSGSAIGVGLVGQTASGVLTVKRQLFSHALVLQILPGTQALYGIVVWFYALMTLGFFGDGLTLLSWEDGCKFFAACIPMALGGLAAIPQGRLCAEGLMTMARRPEGLSKSILMAVMVEFYSILSLLATFLMLNQF